MQRFIFIIISLIVFSACLHDGQKDGFSVYKGVKVLRYDRLQYESVAINSVLALQKMTTESPRATKLLIEDVLALGSVSEPNIYERLCAYYTDSILLKIMEDAEVMFKDMTPIEKELSDGLGVLKEKIPSLVIPCIYSQFSALNQSAVVGDSLLAFSLDKYMGADYPIYKRYYYDYQRRYMTPERIVPDCLTFYLCAQYPFLWEEGHRTLFDIMLYRGKMAWAVEYILKGDVSGRKSLGYTKEEIRWCKKNEAQMWGRMADQHLLESTDPMLIRAYTRPDPCMVVNGEKIPSLIGVWLGMRLIDKYMNDHKEVTLKELLERTDFSGLLEDIKG